MGRGEGMLDEDLELTVRYGVDEMYAMLEEEEGFLLEESLGAVGEPPQSKPSQESAQGALSDEGVPVLWAGPTLPTLAFLAGMSLAGVPLLLGVLALSVLAPGS